ncbi:Ig-like domain-containing protein, partial [Shewanella sp. 10N.261.52.F9]|uniref:Ig-like domain-containing protein n=1 Tax=Shewanella sp. 10N.261.52.F9 TaxID=3229684 RepID=UPI00354B634D
MVAINVTDNVPPTAQNVLANTDSETALAIDLNASIADADGGTVRVTGINQGDSTRFSLSGNIVNYEPNGFIGTDSAVYEVSDGQGGVALASIVINVDDANPLVLNNVPTASDYAQATASDTPVTIDLVTAGLIADADNDPLTVTVFSGQGR